MSGPTDAHGLAAKMPRVMLTLHDQLVQLFELHLVGRPRRFGQLSEAVKGLRERLRITNVSGVMAGERRPLEDRDLRLTNAQGATLDGVRLGDLLELGVSIVSAQRLVGQAGVRPKEPDALV